MKKTHKVNPWAKVIADKMRESYDGVARLDVSQNDLGALLDYLSAENKARRIHSHSTTGSDLPGMKRGKLTRVAVYPAGWKTSAKPNSSKLFESEAEAVKYLRAQRRKGALVRMVNEADHYLDEVFSSIDDPARHKALMRQANKISTGRWIVQTWEPGAMLKHLATDYSEAELIGAAIAGISVTRRRRWTNTESGGGDAGNRGYIAYPELLDLLKKHKAAGLDYSEAEKAIAREKLPRNYSHYKIRDRIERREKVKRAADFYATL